MSPIDDINMWITSVTKIIHVEITQQTITARKRTWNIWWEEYEFARLVDVLENVSEWDDLEEGKQIVINLQTFLIRLLNYLVKNEVNLINANNTNISPWDLMEGRYFKAWRCSLLPQNPRYLLITYNHVNSVFTPI